MSLTIRYREKNKIGVFRLEGIKSSSDVMHAWVRFMLALGKDSIKAILVFDNSIIATTPADVSNIAEELMKNNCPKNKKIAIVAPSSINFLRNSLGETVMFIKGWDNIKVFDDEIGAMEWLKAPL